MRFIESQKRESRRPSYVFEITPREKDLLLATLLFFPQLDTGHHQLSRDPKTANKAGQEWLVETMEQLKLEHKKRLDLFFKNDRRFFKESHGALRFTLTDEQMEWLLRVLNEIRVGSWVRLGQPEMDAVRKIKLTGPQSHLFSAMELSGYFQTGLLEAFA